MPLITVYPNDILVKPCTPVEDDDSTTECLSALLDAYQDLGDGCLGLAANQVGFSMRIVILRVDGKHQFLINPQILSHGTKRITDREYCYSLPEISRLVDAWNEIKVEYIDQYWKQQKMELSGLDARTLQHELQHLDGKTILDHGPKGVSESKLKRMARKYKGLLYV